METEYILLAEKDEMWARMLMEVLQDNGINCAAKPVYGAAVTLKAGKQDRLQIYVPSDKLDEAKNPYAILFSEQDS